MEKDIFISYSRRDQEFVTRLASDLQEQVPGVWFDQSPIQMGQTWHNEILDGIHECKAFVLVLSPDAVESQYVRAEVNKALELGKIILPVLYRPSTFDGEFSTLVQNVPAIDLRPETYPANLPKLVDELNEASASITVETKPLFPPPTRVGMGTLLGKTTAWAFAWSFGWLVFWLVVVAILIPVQIFLGRMDATEARSFMMLLISGGIGGFAGGVLAGLLTMLALRANAPSISWNHMEPTVRIWGFIGPLATLISGVITTVLVAMGIITIQSSNISCDGLSVSQCLFTGFGNMISQAIAMALTFVGVFVLLVLFIWFFTGMFAGQQVMEHLRRLEPDITSRQSRRVTTGWGCGSVVAAGVMIAVFGVLINLMGF